MHARTRTHTQLLIAMANAAKVYHNYTGAASCLNVSVDPAGGGVDPQGWDFQVASAIMLLR